jgi:F1F0 ATPase subunit 2
MSLSWVVAIGVGAGLGLAYFGGLWLTVLSVVRRPSRAAWIPLSGVLRLTLLALGLALLARQGAGSIVAALVGLWLARGYLVRRLGAIGHGA